MGLFPPKKFEIFEIVVSDFLANISVCRFFDTNSNVSGIIRGVKIDLLQHNIKSFMGVETLYRGSTLQPSPQIQPWAAVGPGNGGPGDGGPWEWRANTREVAKLSCYF